jgi:tetratricopeptide (TPR) repeat protein
VRWRLVLCLAGLIALSTAAAGATGPVSLQSEYLDIYLKMNDAAKLEINGDNRGALTEFEDCYTRLAKIHVSYPHWENVLVMTRMGDCRTRITDLEAKLAPAPRKPAAPMPAAGAPPPATTSLKARVATLEAAVRAAPNDPSALFNLAAAYYQTGQTELAIDELQRALAVAPESAPAHNFLGCALMRKGRIESAAKEFLKAVALDEGSADAHYNLAILYATEDPPALKSAALQYRRALELGLVPDPHLQRVLREAGR